MASCHLPLLMNKIVEFYLHVTTHIQWNRKMNLYIVDFFFHSIPLVVCDYGHM